MKKHEKTKCGSNEVQVTRINSVQKSSKSKLSPVTFQVWAISKFGFAITNYCIRHLFACDINDLITIFLTQRVRRLVAVPKVLKAAKNASSVQKHFLDVQQML